jgi:DNA-binding MarR family transcriptional regulator
MNARPLVCLGIEAEWIVFVLINQWQHNFLCRLVELGGSISVPSGVVNEDLRDLIDRDYVRQSDDKHARVRYAITEIGRAAIKYPGQMSDGDG